jgi:hypothetical protein
MPSAVAVVYTCDFLLLGTDAILVETRRNEGMVDRTNALAYSETLSNTHKEAPGEEKRSVILYGAFPLGLPCSFHLRLYPTFA